MTKKQKNIATSNYKQKSISTSTDLDTLSAIWILACNDDNPQITYDGIRFRLGLDNDFAIKELISSRPELFRKKTSEKLLNSWKKEMRLGRKIPSWIKETENSTERTAIIEKLSISDVFRSQFRAEVDSPRSDIEVINWGLQHIERLRKAEIETRKEKTRIFSSIWLPLASLFVAAITVISSSMIQYENIQTQKSLKHYEVELRPKQTEYSNFMNGITQAYYSASEKNRLQLIRDLNSIENSYYLIEPFLSEKDRNELWNKYQEYSGFCNNVFDSTQQKANNTLIDKFIAYRSYFRKDLYIALFEFDKK